MQTVRQAIKDLSKDATTCKLKEDSNIKIQWYGNYTFTKRDRDCLEWIVPTHEIKPQHIL